jgi:hypothetical protein
MRYQMTDILLRNLSEEEVRAIDSKASRLGLSRNEYLRRLVRRELGVVAVTREDLARFAALTRDLGDPDVMSGAWR